MSKPYSARRRFVAALALYLAWVGILAALAITSADRPSSISVPDVSADQEPTAHPAAR